MIDDRVIIKLKAVSELVKAHEVQLVNYLKATAVALTGEYFGEYKEKVRKLNICKKLE